MRMTTPNEFLQFAKEMGLGKVKSTTSTPPLPPATSSSSSISRTLSHRDSYTLTGLSVLNNLCRLIEQIHQLKSENYRLRAHLDLVEHVDRFQHHCRTKDNTKPVLSSLPIHDRNRSDTIPLSKPTKVKRSLSSREHKGHHQDDSSLILSNAHESIDNNSSPPLVPTWNRVRHAFRFTLRRKTDTPSTSPLPHHIERQIPTISISLESEDDLVQDQRLSKTKKRSATVSSNDHRQILVGDETDHDDESTQVIRTSRRTQRNGNESSIVSSIDRQEIHPSFNPTNTDDEHVLTRKQSKIAHYRRKLRSKLDTVKRQFSEQNSSSNVRRPPNSPAMTFDEIGSGLNYALLTAQLAPALTKSYQQKMRDWEIMQKSQFLVNYRRQSITPKSDPNTHPSKNSLTELSAEKPVDPIVPSSPIDSTTSFVDQYKIELEPKFSTITPILSPNQRTLIVHQWRQIMSEEIFLRHYTNCLQKKMLLLKDLEANLKDLKTNIFCTNHLIKSQSMNHLNQRISSSTKRCQSLESFIFIPASWSLAVQSSAYSDVLDGTSNKTTERTFLFNQTFFNQLEHFKGNRAKFEEDFLNDLQFLNHSKLDSNTHLPGKQLHARCVSTRACLRKLSLISSAEFPQYFLPDPILPPQTITTHYQTVPSDELSPITTINDESIPIKQTKRSRFDLVKNFQRSRSMYMTQFHSWLQRRRQHSPVRRRKSTVESKVSTPKLFGSPRLARLQQRLFKTSAPSSPQSQRTTLSNEFLDDADRCTPFELPVRIYFPPSSPSTTRHVRINEKITITSDTDQDDVSSSVVDRKSASLSSTFRMTTAKERRESFVTLSNVFNQRYL